MTTSTFFLGIAIVAALAGVAFSIGIVSFLLQRGEKINWIFIRVMILKYIGQYRDITIQETGKTGPLYHAYIIAMNTALVFAVIGMVLR